MIVAWYRLPSKVRELIREGNIDKREEDNKNIYSEYIFQDINVSFESYKWY